MFGIDTKGDARAFKGAVLNVSVNCWTACPGVGESLIGLTAGKRQTNLASCFSYPAPVASELTQINSPNCWTADEETVPYMLVDFGVRYTVTEIIITRQKLKNITVEGKRCEFLFL